jgi:hypothetical protein
MKGQNPLRVQRLSAPSPHLAELQTTMLREEAHSLAPQSSRTGGRGGRWLVRGPSWPSSRPPLDGGAFSASPDGLFPLFRDLGDDLAESFSPGPLADIGCSGRSILDVMRRVGIAF